MANFSVVPAALSFNKAVVRGPVAGLYPTAQTLSFVFKNTSGSSITITDWGFSNSTEGDAVTQPNGVYKDTDFTVAVNAGSFPVTVANNASQQFDVTYTPIRRGSGFGDVRSALIVLFAGQKVVSNPSPYSSPNNAFGEPQDLRIPIPLVIGVGGGVVEEGFDWATVHPIFWDAGKIQVGSEGEISGSRGMTPNMSIADIDSGRHSLSAIELFSGTTAGSTAAPIRAGARSIEVLVYGLDTATSFDMIIQVLTSAGLVTVASYTGLNYTNVGKLFIGNQGGDQQADGAAINLQGLPLSATISNVTNPNNVTIKIGAVVLG